MNPNSASQQTRRNAFKAGSQAWRSLTDAQRSAWNNAAALIPLQDSLGRTYYRTGQEYYVSTWVNCQLYAAGTAVPADPGTITLPAALASMTATAVAGPASFSVAYTATPLAANTKVVIECSGMLSPGVNFVKRSLLKVVHVSAAAAASPANILAAYNAIFGGLVVGKKIMVRVTVLSSTGGRSTSVSSLITVA